MVTKILKFLMGALIAISAFLFVAANLCGCSSGPQVVGDVVNPVDGSDELDVYVRLFVLEAKNRGLDMKVNRLFFDVRLQIVDQFKPSYEREGVIGLCSYAANVNTISISREAWNRYDSLQREMLIFHEFGHCILDQHHDEAETSEGVPMDIMYPANFSSVYYARARSEYLDRMFEKIAARLRVGEDPSKFNKNITSYRCKWGEKKVYDGTIKRERETPGFGRKRVDRTRNLRTGRSVGR